MLKRADMEVLPSTAMAPVHITSSPSPDVPQRLSDRLQQGLLLICAVDALLVYAFVLLGLAPPHLGALWLVLGVGLQLTTLTLVRRRERGRFSELTLLTFSCFTCVLLSGYGAWQAPQIGALLLMNGLSAIAASAVRLPVIRMLGAGAVLLLLCSAVFVLAPEKPQLPLHSPAEQGLTLLWISSLALRSAGVSLVGGLLQRRLDDANRKLVQALDQVRATAALDELTGIPNRRSMMSLLAEQLDSHRAFSLALLDIDHFKQVNDRCGHVLGDAVLCRFAQVVSKALPPGGIVSRHGGEEFLVLLPGHAELDAACAALERVRCAVLFHEWASLDARLQITVSIGIALARRGEEVHELLERTDRALYQAKAAGRNRVVPPPQGHNRPALLTPGKREPALAEATSLP